MPSCVNSRCKTKPFFFSFEKLTPPHMPHSGSLSKANFKQRKRETVPLTRSKHIYICNQTPFCKLHYLAVNYYRGGKEVCPQLSLQVIEFFQPIPGCHKNS